MGDGSGYARKALVIGVCVLSLAACLGLAWWQWERFESTNGTFQNLGYVLQWPLFGLAPAYMVWRYRKLKAREADRPDSAPKPVKRPTPAVEGDDELAAYNRYLAALNEQENR
ncbi:hypothetical protein [Alloactinosynnema sp. L-07]|uniref:hypothetical protein n=1 Tax=Alloactinosynnema sp. L-07 TaxID=1653480 RepID=UPI00065F013B|nr:hypothetical protein [Alloactinosynnema sp. L-07]CRK58347.1 hypothetical protein [Alloactinosynnema sp. L-07]